MHPFKCDDFQPIYYKLAQNIAICLERNAVSECYKYLKLIVKFQTHSRNEQKLKNTSSISLIDMLGNIGVEIDNLSEKVMIDLLTEQLKLYQSTFSYNTTVPQIEILETLLKKYFSKNQSSIQRALCLIDLAKLVRIQKEPKIENESIRTPKKGEIVDILHK